MSKSRGPKSTENDDKPVTENETVEGSAAAEAETVGASGDGLPGEDTVTTDADTRSGDDTVIGADDDDTLPEASDDLGDDGGRWDDPLHAPMEETAERDDDPTLEAATPVGQSARRDDNPWQTQDDSAEAALSGDDTLAASHDDDTLSTSRDGEDGLATDSGDTLAASNSDTVSSYGADGGGTTGAVPPAALDGGGNRGGGFVPMVLGGAVAAALGFGAAWYLGQDDSFETESRDTFAAQTTQIEDLSGQVTALKEGVSARITALEEDVAALQEVIGVTQGDLSAVADRVGATESFAEQIAALDERLTTLAKKPIADTVSREAIAAYESELERLRGSMEEQRLAIEETVAAEKAKIEQIAAEATQMEERALEEARLAAARSAMTRIVSALDNGTGFEGALAELQDNVEAETDALAAVAAEGVATQNDLRERFPDDARAALRAARANAPEDEGGGIGGVLENMFQVRSVEPRDGVSADAVLSRAEAAVRRGDLAEALTEIETLPEPAKEVLSEWVADAEARRAALDEANAIAARLNQ